jgi:hypothetical protein
MKCNEVVGGPCTPDGFVAVELSRMVVEARGQQRKTMGEGEDGWPSPVSPGLLIWRDVYMNANCWRPKYCALGLAIGLSVFLVGCATLPSSKSPHSYQLSDIEGTWSWTQNPWHGDFVLKRDGDSCAGTLNDVYEGTYGDRIKDVTILDNHVKFTRANKGSHLHISQSAVTRQGGVRSTPYRLSPKPCSAALSLGKLGPCLPWPCCRSPGREPWAASVVCGQTTSSVFSSQRTVRFSR